MNIVISSGFFNPLGPHHIKYLHASKHLHQKPQDNYHICIINSDYQVAVKGSIPFMPQKDRLFIVSSLRCVDEAMVSIDITGSIQKTIQFIYEKYKNHDHRFYFTNGGPIVVDDNEEEVCKKFGIERLWEVGGIEKENSSSWMIENVAKIWMKRNE